MNHKFCLLAVFQLSRAAKNGIIFFCRAVIMLLNFERQRAKGTRQVTAITCQDIISCVEYSDYSLCHFETSMKNSINNWPFFFEVTKSNASKLWFQSQANHSKSCWSTEDTLSISFYRNNPMRPGHIMHNSASIFQNQSWYPKWTKR